MDGDLMRMRRAPTYAHKGQVVHIFRPVIHADNELSSTLESHPGAANRRKNRDLFTIAHSSTLIVDNFASCG
jgi:hypothetical protein